MKIKNIFLFEIMGIFLISNLCSQPTNINEYENPEEIILIGKITIKDFYGPPNYGENPNTDTRESFYFLLLNEPILIKINDITYNVTELQMILTNKIMTTINIQEEYTVKGKLFLPHTGHHHSDILIFVNEIYRPSATN